MDEHIHNWHQILLKSSKTDILHLLICFIEITVKMKIDRHPATNS